MSQYTLVDPLTELLDANPADLVAVSVVPTTLHKALCDIIRHVRQHDEQIASMKSQSHAIRDTMKSQSGTKIAHALNFIRPATAPEMRAGVIAANIPRNAIVAKVPPSPAAVMSLNRNESKLPMKSLSNGTCASE